MYHRYMQNENGQYQRKTVPDATRLPPPETSVSQQEQPTQQFHAPPPPPPEKNQSPEKGAERSDAKKEQRIPAQDHIPILEKLLPGMDSGDVLVLLILLFLLSEGNEDSTGVIMTLAIFLFLQ